MNSQEAISTEETQKILEIFHQLSEQRALTTSKDFSAMTDTVLHGITSGQVALNVRVKLIEITGETAFSCFPNRLGNFLDCFLSVLQSSMSEIMQGDEVVRKSKVIITEAILRALVSLCSGSPSSNQPHMVRELTDVFLQIAHFCHIVSKGPVDSSASAVDVSRVSTAVSKALQRMPHLNFESVLVKVMHWINRNSRQEEKNDDIQQSEARFASLELTRIIRDQLLHIHYSKEGSSEDIVRENMRKFFVRSFNAMDNLKSSDAIRSIWRNGMRKTGLFDDHRTAKILYDSMLMMTGSVQNPVQERKTDEYFTSNLVIVEVILSECALTRSLDANTLLSYLKTLLIEAEQLSSAKSPISKTDAMRFAMTVCVLLCPTGKHDPTGLENLFLQYHSIFFDAVNDYITATSSTSAVMDVFFVEALLGQLVEVIVGCPVLLLKILQIKKTGEVNACFTDGPSSSIIVEKVVRLLQNLVKVKDLMGSSVMKEILYAAKRKCFLHRGQKITFSNRYLHAFSMVQRFVEGFLDSSSQFPRASLFSWELLPGKKSRQKRGTDHSSPKQSKIWIPTGVKESLNRQMLQN
mmetsp:Transcript_17938/g.28063  ORF Transcript_17938/g.28063 Transcript_17938/m.28063 type:complete len:579 (-) Transcript_17938:18-1754(-)